MKKAAFFSILLASLVMLYSCSDDGIDIEINNPQHIEFLNILPEELLEAFGEENIYFGHTPPVFDSLIFYVDSLEYEVCRHFIYDQVTHEPILSHYPLVYDPTYYYHYFYNHIDNTTSDSLLYYGPGQHDKVMMVYEGMSIIGSGDKFTVYFEERPNRPYRPINGILISGTLVHTTDTVYSETDTTITKRFLGVKDYRMGKMIIDYEDPVPYDAQVYLKSSVDVKVHIRELAPYFNPDTCTIWQQYN